MSLLKAISEYIVMTDSDYAESLSEAVSIAHKREFDNRNGINATNPVTVEYEKSYVKVIRKASFEKGPIVVFRVIPKNRMEPRLDSIGNDILDAMDICGDLKVSFETHGKAETAIIGI